MSPHQGQAFGSRVKSLLCTVARQIASAIRTPSGQGTLPTKSQLMKLGPQDEFTRGSPHSNGW